MDCNLRCKYCFEDKYHRKQYMSKKTIDDIKKQIVKDKNFLCDNLQFFGGEPMLYEECIIDFIKTFKDKLTYVIMTNGTIPFDNFIKNTSNYAKNILINFSYDASANNLRQQNKASTIYESYNKLKKNGYNVQTVSVYTPQFVENLKENILELSKKFNPFCIKRLDDVMSPENTDSICKVTNSISKLILLTLYVNNKYNTLIILPDNINLTVLKEGFARRSYWCDTYTLLCTIIGVDGKLYPCGISVLDSSLAYANSIKDWRKKPQFFDELLYNKKITKCHLRNGKLDIDYEKKIENGRIFYAILSEKFKRLQHVAQH